MSILVRVVVQRNSIRVLLLKVSVVGHGGLHQLCGSIQFGGWLLEGPLSLYSRGLSWPRLVLIACIHDVRAALPGRVLM